MSEKQDKFDLKETLEVYDFVDGYLDSLAEAKQNDGNIDMIEHGMAAAKNAPAAIKAIVGANQMDDEIMEAIREADQEELKELALRSYLTIQKLAALLMGSK